MEQPSEDISIFNLRVNEETKVQLAGVAQWANINAIIGFVGLGLTLLSTGISIVQLSKYTGGGSITAGAAVSTVIMAAISFLLNITLFNAAKFMKAAATNNDQGAFGMGINKLASYFKIISILLIIVIVICVLAFLAMSLSRGSRY